jgi:hypothetical protein
MKKLIPFFSLAILVACNSKPSETETRTIQSTQTSPTTPDTAGYAEFQQWKAQNELASATAPQTQQSAPAAAPVKTVTVVREVRVPQQAPARKPSTRRPPTTAPEETKSGSTTTNSGGGNDVASNSGSSTTADAPAAGTGETAKDKGWSKSTKGAVIGGAGGAVLGAIINKKNRAAGAVIGGVLGAGVGYGVGKHKDNKTTQQQ